MMAPYRGAWRTCISGNPDRTREQTAAGFLMDTVTKLEPERPVSTMPDTMVIEVNLLTAVLRLLVKQMSWYQADPGAQEKMRLCEELTKCLVRQLEETKP
jgi:hypothetical protein